MKRILVPLVVVMTLGLAVTLAGQSGNFQLNVTLPLIAYNLLQDIAMLANAARLLADRAIAGFTVDRARMGGALARNPMLVTALNAVIGFSDLMRLQAFGPVGRLLGNHAPSGQPLSDGLAKLIFIIHKQQADRTTFCVIGFIHTRPKIFHQTAAIRTKTPTRTGVATTPALVRSDDLK